jgi:hypothetical protein
MKPGDIVEHKLDKEWVLVVEINNEFIRCRTKSFDIIDFFDFELRERYR